MTWLHGGDASSQDTTLDWSLSQHSRVFAGLGRQTSVHVTTTSITYTILTCIIQYQVNSVINKQSTSKVYTALRWPTPTTWSWFSQSHHSSFAVTISHSTINEWINESMNESISQSVSHINPSINQSIKALITMAISSSTSHSQLISALVTLSGTWQGWFDWMPGH